MSARLPNRQSSRVAPLLPPSPTHNQCSYAKTDIAFEEIVLRIQKTGDRQALMCFLVNKLSDLSFRDVTQRTMICTWLTELHLAKLSSCTAGTDEFVNAMSDLESFLSESSSMMHRDTVYSSSPLTTTPLLLIKYIMEQVRAHQQPRAL